MPEPMLSTTVPLWMLVLNFVWPFIGAAILLAAWWLRWDIALTALEVRAWLAGFFPQTEAPSRRVSSDGAAATADVFVPPPFNQPAAKGFQRGVSVADWQRVSSR
jgi:hypothetical protein